MAKAIVKLQQNKTDREAALGRVKKVLSEQHACYVLITCSEPSKGGKMEVEMSYEGDETLAAFLLENASQVFDERISESK